MRRKNPSKVLLVEGKTEQLLIPFLMEANGIDWPAKKPPIWIEDCNGYANIIKEDAIATELQSRNLTALGIIVDADEYPERRWQSLRDACIDNGVAQLPQDLPSTGLIHSHSIIPERQIRFGVWMMPDNTMRGMLETFLAELVPDETNELWQYAGEAVNIARTSKGAKVKDVHLDKANIHTWLAWQEEPGLQLHQAIAKKFLSAPQC